MAINNVKPHYGNAAEFQVSSWPFVSSSIVYDTTIAEISFPYVTRWITVHNGGHGTSKILHFGFTQNGVGVDGDTDGNYYTLHDGEQSQRLELKCKSLFIRAEGGDVPFSVMAGLTNVGPQQFPTISGSNGFIGVG